ncbi:hypothetical protein E2I00_005928, partial [Balaenoptera physalus]
MVDVKCLSDDELQNKLDKLGFSPGPILHTSYVLMAYFPFVSHDPEFNVTIILKGNIIFSSEKNKGPKK